MHRRLISNESGGVERSVGVCCSRAEGTERRRERREEGLSAGKEREVVVGGKKKATGRKSSWLVLGVLGLWNYSWRGPGRTRRAKEFGERRDASEERIKTFLKGSREPISPFVPHLDRSSKSHVLGLKGGRQRAWIEKEREEEKEKLTLVFLLRSATISSPLLRTDFRESLASLYQSRVGFVKRRSIKIVTYQRS